MEHPFNRERPRGVRRPDRIARGRADESRAGEHAPRVSGERDEGTQRVTECALPDREAEQHDVPSHHGGEDIETQEHDGIDGARREGEGDEEQVTPARAVHGQPSASSAITSGSERRSGRTRVGDVSSVSP